MAAPACLFCRQVLLGVSSGRCPECGRPFDLGDLDSFQVAMELPERLTACADEAGAEALRLALRADGILSWCEATTQGVVGFGERRTHAIWVEAEDLERARGCLARARSAHGTGADWICPDCGEEVPGSFERCWNCP